MTQDLCLPLSLFLCPSLTQTHTQTTQARSQTKYPEPLVTGDWFQAARDTTAKKGAQQFRPRLGKSRQKHVCLFVFIFAVVRLSHEQLDETISKMAAVAFDDGALRFSTREESDESIAVQLAFRVTLQLYALWGHLVGRESRECWFL